MKRLHSTIIRYTGVTEDRKVKRKPRDRIKMAVSSAVLKKEIHSKSLFELYFKTQMSIIVLIISRIIQGTSNFIATLCNSLKNIRITNRRCASKQYIVDTFVITHSC